MSEQKKDLENHVALAAEQSREGRSSTAAHDLLMIVEEARRIWTHRPFNWNAPDPDFNTQLTVDYNPGARFNRSIPERALIWRGLAQVYEGEEKHSYFVTRKKDKRVLEFSLLEDRIRLTSFGAKYLAPAIAAAVGDRPADATNSNPT